MQMGESAPTKTKRFTDFTATDLMIRHCVKDFDGVARVVYEVGTVRRMIAQFNWMEKTLKKVAKSNTPSVQMHRRGYSLSRDATNLWHVLRNVDEAPKELCEGRRLSPWLKLGLRLARKWEPRLQDFTNCDGLLDVNLEYPRKMMSHIVKVIRRVCRSKRFRDVIKNHTRTSRDNYLSCADYMLDMLRVYARPLVLRVDLYFEGDAKVFSESEAAGKAHNKFMRNLSESKIVPDVLAYISKRENGLERRIHFHVLIALDGNKHWQAHSLTEELGRYWVGHCVGSSLFASYKNCFERKDEYEFNCLGLLHYADEDMLRGLRLALEYLCKEDSHILVGAGMGRNLRKGQSPDLPADGERRGAPRKYGNDVSLAERILLAKTDKMLPRPVRSDSVHPSVWITQPIGYDQSADQHDQSQADTGLLPLVQSNPADAWPFEAMPPFGMNAPEGTIWTT